MEDDSIEDEEQRQKEAYKERREQQAEIDNILSGLTGKEFQKLHNVKEARREKIEEFLKIFDPPEKPDMLPAIQSYLKSQATRKLYRDLYDTAAQDKTKKITPKEMLDFSREIVKRLI